VQVADLGHLLAVLLAQQVDRLLADHAQHAPPTRVHRHALADEDLRIPAADGPEPQVAVIVDVGHDQADLVDVPDHEQPSRFPLEAVLGGHPRERGPEHVGAHVGELARRLAPDRRGRRLIARRPTR
jgi:hypothetical protein